jgi:hypothetical protein
MTVSVVALIFFVLLLACLNITHDNGGLSYFDKVVHWIDEYYRDSIATEGSCLNAYDIPMYFPGLTKCPTGCTGNNGSGGSTGGSGGSGGSSGAGSGSCGSNIININCGGTTSQESTNSKPCSCKSAPTPVVNPGCPPNYCQVKNETILGNYKYVLDKLPGIIIKYTLDECKNVIQDSRENMYHSLGSLKRIYVNAGKIVVEDSLSSEHIASISSTTGSLTF